MAGEKEYEALAARASAFFAEVTAAAPASFQCQKGCSQCCHVSLSLSPVESAAMRTYLAEHHEVRARLHARLATRPPEDARCIMLDDAGACDVYPARPLVCRTQGLALLYPADVIPAAAVRARSKATPPGDITWCPLNYAESTPAAAHVLDAGRLDLVHAQVSRTYADGAGQDPSERTHLRQIAAE